MAASAVIDARGAAPPAGLDLAWQKFVGLTCRFAAGHGVERPVIMDARVAQDEGYRFVYSLPFSDTELMVEDTYYSTSPVLDVPMVRGRLGSHIARRGFGLAEIVGEESGVLPVLLGGDLESLWRPADPPVARLGLRGGFFHPTTGYSLPDAVRNAALLAEQPDLGGAALHSLFRRRASTLWDRRRFYQRLNRMLFRAAEPRLRYRVLEHFYRLPEAVIARFYAGPPHCVRQAPHPQRPTAGARRPRAARHPGAAGMSRPPPSSAPASAGSRWRFGCSRPGSPPP
jgi:lycopene beta-cyclase